MQTQEAFRIIEKSIGKVTPDEALTILNDAGEWFVGFQPWNFMVRGPVAVDVRPDIELTAAAWTASTRTLTLASAFSDYSWVAGDQIEILSGTDCTLRHFTVESRTSANAIVLTESISSANQTDVEATLHASYAVALPAAFSGFLHGFPAVGWGNAAGGFDMEDLQAVHDSRTAFGGGGAASYIGAITGWPGESGVVVTRLEIAPPITAGLDGAFVIAYRAKWTRATTSTTSFDMPHFAEPAFRSVLRAFAKGYEEEDEATVDQRLIEVVDGPVWAQLVMNDARLQPDFGRTDGGLVQVANQGAGLHDFEIEDPS